MKIFFFFLSLKSFKCIFEKFESLIHSVCVFQAKVFCVGRCNGSSFGIFLSSSYLLFLEDSDGPEKDFKCLTALVLERTNWRQVQCFYCYCCLASADYGGG